MCGPTKAPPVVKDDPIADAKKAKAKATSESNAELAARRRRLAQNSLLTLGSQGTGTRVDTADNLLASIDKGVATKRGQADNPRDRLRRKYGNKDYIRDTLRVGIGDPTAPADLTQGVADRLGVGNVFRALNPF